MGKKIEDYSVCNLKHLGELQKDVGRELKAGCKRGAGARKHTEEERKALLQKKLAIAVAKAALLNKNQEEDAQIAASSGDVAEQEEEEGAQPTSKIVPKRKRNDHVKRATTKKAKRQRDREKVFAAAGMAGSYAKGARFVLAAAERDTENVAEQEEGPKDLYVETKPKTVQEESKPDLYVISTREEPNVIKIGQSTDPRRRLRSLQTANSKVLVLKVIFPNAGKYEHEVHEALAQERLLGEWFRVYLPVALTVISETVEKCSLRDLASSPSQFDTATKQSQGSTPERLAPVN